MKANNDIVVKVDGKEFSEENGMLKIDDELYDGKAIAWLERIRMAKKLKKPPEAIYILVDTQEDSLKGCFKDEAAVLRYVEREGIEEGRVFKCTEVFDCIAPEEPEYALVNRKLKDVLSGHV